VLGDGERDDPALRGALTGLSLRHGRGELARAMLEGSALEMGLHLDLLRGAGTPVTELRVSGGDARLTTWNQVKADVLGIPVVRIAGDAAVTGVAMLAGIGAGVYRDVDEAIARCVHIAERREPDPSAAGTYRAIAQRYRELVDAAVVRRGGEPGT
jgi:xylulokinase